MSKKNQKTPVGIKERPQDRAERVREEAGRFRSRIERPKKGGGYNRNVKHKKRSREGAYD